MPDINADEVVMYAHKRHFIQFGGAQPGNVVQYAGQDGQYMFVDGVGVPETGGVTPIFVPDPRQPGKWRLIARTIDPPDLASASLVMLEKHGAIPRQLQRIGCKFNLYEPTGPCQDLSDFLRGWTDYILVYGGALVNDKDLGTRTARDSDGVVEDTLSLTLADVYPVGALAFGEKAAAQVEREVVDVVYGTTVSCQCVEGTEYIYALETYAAGSPGLPTEVVYTVDGGENWTNIAVDGMGADEIGYAIDIVGKYLVVLGEDNIYWAEINYKTGVPGTFTQINTGIVLAGTPRDIYVLSPREVFFCGDGGYIYKATDITAGVSVIDAGSATTQDLARIDGVDETIIACGAVGAVIKSSNRGSTWATTTASPSGDTLQALEVLDDDRYWIGTSGGEVYYTLDGGEIWTEKAFTGSSAGEVRDILFVNDEVGYFAHDTVAPLGRIFSTWNGGEDWINADPRLLNLPVFDYAGRLAAPDADAGIAANNLAVAGLAGNGVDGILLLGIAGRI